MFNFFKGKKKSQDALSKVEMELLSPYHETQLTKINEKNKNGKTSLHKAIQHDNFDFALAILNLPDINPDLEDDNGNTPLHLSAIKNNAEWFNQLLNQKVSIDKTNKKGETPLHLAVKSHQVKNVYALVEKNANPSLATFPTLLKSYFEETGLATPLHYAFYYAEGDLSSDIITALMSAGADVNALDQNKFSPLHLALSHKNIESLDKSTLNQLMDLTDLSLTSEHNTPLHAAAKNKKLPSASFHRLLKKYAEHQPVLIDKPDAQGNTALFYAIYGQQNEKTILLLDEAQANPNLFNLSGPSPLNMAMKFEHSDIAIKLMNAGANVNQSDGLGFTPLMHAASLGNLILIDHLKEKGADFTGKDGETALKLALSNHHCDTAIKLIEYGVNPNIHLYPNSSLMKISSISSKSCDLKSGFATGDTPLHYAVKAGNEALATICLKVKPEMVNATNEKGKTAAHLAIKYLLPKMAHLLYTHGTRIEASQPCPGMLNSAYHYLHQSRQNTLAMEAATKGFSSLLDLDQFFKDADYQLSDQQLKIKEKQLHHQLALNSPNISKLSLLKELNIRENYEQENETFLTNTLSI